MIDLPYCPRCGIPFPSPQALADAPEFVCGTCRLKEPPFAQARSVGYYDGTLRETSRDTSFKSR